MGKRKERRLAAKIGAGRRVKLDLFADPSGDLGGSSANDEDGKDVDAKHDRELPNSPSSSGQPRENPLSLLGQYSDDELDDGSNQATTNFDEDKQAGCPLVEPIEDGEIVDTEDNSSQKIYSMDVDKDSTTVSVSPIAEVDDVKSNPVNLDGKDHKADIENKAQSLVTSDTIIPDSMNSTWKMVLHEESNQYYYWNTVSGETSWELPDSLGQEIASFNKLETSAAEVKETSIVDANATVAYGVNLNSYSASHGLGYTGEISDMKAMYESGASIAPSLEHSGAVGGQFSEGFPLYGGILHEASSLENYSLSSQINGSSGDSAAGSYGVHGQNSLTKEGDAVDLPLHLVKNGEALLEKLKLLQGSWVDSVDNGWLSKCALEIEIRISDIKCLLSYAPSLIPLWMHLERQFNRLENDIDAEIRKQKSTETGLDSPSEGKETFHEVERGTTVDTNMRKTSPEYVVANPHIVDSSSLAQEAVHDEILGSSILNVQQNSIQDTIAHPLSNEKGGRETDQGKEIPSCEPQSNNEDVDMDIDMEVEDQSPRRKRMVNTGDQMASLSGQLALPSVQLSGPSIVPESEFVIPPPPQEEWIPPPPPDEGIPPPPPDEPPESLYPPPPPSEPEPAASIYSQQANITYPSMDYYGNTITESSGASFYENADAAQIAGVIPSAYYAAISNAQPTSVLNPTDSSAYYVIQNGALSVVPVPATVECSNILVATSHPTYDPSEQSKTDNDPTKSVSASVASTLVTAPTKEYASAPSYSAAATSVTTSTLVAASDSSTVVPKVQSKAPRMKKPRVAVASLLRSNKKVSGLVDKWKAAKEELQEEEEEERETPLEILEKKKRREIEEWRAQQIASGEAKENANFQPLGGDWRERVKRRRAQKEAVSGTTSDTANGIKKPDNITELSKDLPSGWQAYLDESSNQVYYANSVTAETTWTRPTR